MLIISVLVGFLYAPVLWELAVQWAEDPNYSHGFLIPLVAGYLVWERRKLPEARPSIWGLPLLIFGLLLLLAGKMGAEMFLMRVSLLFVLAGLFLYIAGRDALTRFLFPILFLLLMIPIPAIVFNAIAFPLQLFAAKTATEFLSLVSIPVYREGNVIYLTQTTLDVAEACSGIRSLISLLALGAIYGYFTQKMFLKRAVVTLSAVPIAIGANAFRVAGTGLLAQHFGVKVAEGFYHTFSGWLIFVAGLSLLALTGAVVSRVSHR